MRAGKNDEQGYTRKNKKELTSLMMFSRSSFVGCSDFGAAAIALSISTKNN
jgi:hypothetical protein